MFEDPLPSFIGGSGQSSMIGVVEKVSLRLLPLFSG